MKHHVSVFYVHGCNDLPQKHEIEIFKGLVNEYYYYYQKSNVTFKFLRSFINTWKFLKGHWILRKKISRPNLIHVHILTRLGVIAYMVNKWKHIPYIITEHWSRYQTGNKGYEGFLRKFLTRLVTANAGALTTVTHQLKVSMEKHGIINPHHHVLHNVVDTKVFFPENRSYRDTEIKKLIHVSCFDDEPKNISGLIDCIQGLHQLRQDFIVEMIGTGKDYEKIVNKCKSLGLYDTTVFFTGQLEGAALGQKVRGADILMLFSNYENMPVVINEAFCCGVPVISTNVGGISEIVNDSNGVLVPKGDQAAFIKELNTMLDHPHKYDQKAISQKAFQNFSMLAISEQLDQIYSQNTYT
jgi:glycosyltransferase involved in cell wall biosynthesis